MYLSEYCTYPHSNINRTAVDTRGEGSMDVKKNLCLLSTNISDIISDKIPQLPSDASLNLSQLFLLNLIQWSG